MTTDPQVSDAELQAYADERLPQERRAAVEAWLATRPEETERVAAYRRLRAARRAGPDPRLGSTGAAGRKPATCQPASAPAANPSPTQPAAAAKRVQLCPRALQRILN